MDRRLCLASFFFFVGVGGTITIDTFYDNESLEKAASNHRLASRLLILQ